MHKRKKSAPRTDEQPDKLNTCRGHSVSKKKQYEKPLQVDCRMVIVNCYYSFVYFCLFCLSIDLFSSLSSINQEKQKNTNIILGIIKNPVSKEKSVFCLAIPSAAMGWKIPIFQWILF